MRTLQLVEMNLAYLSAADLVAEFPQLGYPRTRRYSVAEAGKGQRGALAKFSECGQQELESD